MNLVKRFFVVIMVINGFAFSQKLNKKLKVGIVGGGIGGSAAAYNLQNLLKGKVEITVFEKNAIGGRLSTRTLGSGRYEAGGSIVISRNRYISQFVDKLSLKKRSDEHVGYSALYDGKQVVFAENDWKIISISQLFWRYGFGIYYLNSHIGQMLDSFDRIYHEHDKLNGFENVSSLLAAMNPNFVNDLQTKSSDGFAREGFSNPVIQELVAGTLRVNYGQHLEAHKFVGSVSVSGAGGGLWAVEGGNDRVPQRLIEESGARVVLRGVKSLVKRTSGRIAVVLDPRSDISEEKPEEFDVVIIAAPQAENMPHAIKFDGFPEEPKFRGRYHRTVSTLLRGTLRTDQFPGLYPYSDEIITTKPGSLFNSISRVYPVDSQPPVNSSDVWKVFSQRPLTTAELSNWFSDVRDVTVVDWLAYPEYDTSSRDDRFLLGPNLYYLNAIEWAASAMEMSLVGAKNVAILVRNEWCATHDCEKAGNPEPVKSEL